jgi:catechol 2,3-dioxygenase-like lactoylglutathione lyase family enzyme
VTKRILACWLIVAAVLGAQPSPSSTEPLMRTAQGAFFAVVVPDIQASAAWYQEKLGLKVVMPLSRHERSSALALEGGGLIVEVIQNDDAVPLTKAAPAIKGELFVHGIAKVGVVVDDFDRTVAQLKTRGIEIVAGPFPTRPNMRANVLVKDNNGNLIQFFGK